MRFLLCSVKSGEIGQRRRPTQRSRVRLSASSAGGAWDPKSRMRLRQHGHSAPTAPTGLWKPSATPAVFARAAHNHILSGPSPVSPF